MARQAGPQVLQNSFSNGIRRNRSKDSIGANSAWDLVDYIPDLKGAPLTKRGRWERKGVFSGSPSWINAGIFAHFNGGKYILVADAAGEVWRTTAGGSTWSVDGTTRDVGFLRQNPIMYFDDVFWPSPDGSQTMSHSNEVATTEYVQTSTFKPVYLIPWKNRLIGAVGERIVPGPPGDPGQPWDDDAVYVMDQRITGLATVATITMIFYEGHTDRLRGTTPAGYDVVEGDFDFSLLWPEVGCMDAFSICKYNDAVIWADRNGVYLTDGAIPIDLTERGGIRDYWREVMEPLTGDIDNDNIRVACGMLAGDVLKVTITNHATQTHIKTFVCNVPARVWWTDSNHPFACYFPSAASPTGGNKELFAGTYVPTREVAELSHTFEPGQLADENGVDILPVVEYPYARFAAGTNVIVDAYLGYQLEGVPLLEEGADTAASWLFLPDSTIDMGNDDILFEAVDVGVGGNLLVISIPGFATPDLPLEVTIGNDLLQVGDTGIIIQLATDGAGLITSTVADVLALLAGDVDVSALITATLAGTPNDGSAILDVNAITNPLSGGGGGTLTPQKALHFEFTTQPMPRNVTYDDFNDGAEFLGAQDVHGEESDDYHYRRIPVRKTAPGIGVRVTQVVPSEETRIYNLSVETQPQPGWSQA